MRRVAGAKPQLRQPLPCRPVFVSIAEVAGVHLTVARRLRPSQKDRAAGAGAEDAEPPQPVIDSTGCGELVPLQRFHDGQVARRRHADAPPSRRLRRALRPERGAWADIPGHVIGCHLTHATRVQNALGDVRAMSARPTYATPSPRPRLLRRQLVTPQLYRVQIPASGLPRRHRLQRCRDAERDARTRSTAKANARWETRRTPAGRRPRRYGTHEAEKTGP